jgi:hypothetical protein
MGYGLKYHADTAKGNLFQSLSSAFVEWPPVYTNSGNSGSPVLWINPNSEGRLK